MLEFVIPIFYPKKPMRVTVTVGNKVFGAYMGERDVDWALVMKDTVRRLLIRIDKSKPTPICPYLLHFYITQKVVQPKEKKVYMVEESFMLHDIKQEEDEPAGSEDSGNQELEFKGI